MDGFGGWGAARCTLGRKLWAFPGHSRETKKATAQDEWPGLQGDLTAKSRDVMAIFRGCKGCRMFPATLKFAEQTRMKPRGKDGTTTCREKIQWYILGLCDKSLVAGPAVLLHQARLGLP